MKEKHQINIGLQLNILYQKKLVLAQGQKSKQICSIQCLTGYAILASEITKSILLNGLDPYCGFLHFDKNNRTSLTFDLIEPFRQQIVDKTIIGLVNRKQITLKDIDKRNNTIKLEARKIIIKKILSKIYSTITYEDKTISYSDLIRKQSKNIVEVLLNDAEFKGFYLRW